MSARIAIRKGSTWRLRTDPTKVRRVHARLVREGTVYIWTEGVGATTPAISSFTADRFIEQYEPVR